ncbi:MAG TPA: fasciclin domain-containing protein [Anaerolineales bacterium]|nr:fasciclin domain-containing protein [Anaerolineales bacterium]
MKNSIGIRFVYALLIAAFAFSAFATPTAQAQETGTIVDVALAANAQTAEFSILIAALQAANPDVIRKLSNPQKEFTVFAPTDAAFTALLAELGVTAEELLSDKMMLSRILRYHIARGELEAAEVLASDRIRTVQGGRIWQASGVLTDANGRTSNIVQTDIQASNGVIHVIDNVLLPKPKPTKVDGSIVDAALQVNAETGEFSILIAALQAAHPDIIQRLDQTGAYTVFAPTDTAFLDLLDELGMTAEELLSNRPLVSRVLRYHMVRDELDSTEVLASKSIRTWQGGRIWQAGGVLTDVNGRSSNIIDVDIQTNNGIIHVIDTVLLPNMSSGMQN